MTAAEKEAAKAETGRLQLQLQATQREAARLRHRILQARRHRERSESQQQEAVMQLSALAQRCEHNNQAGMEVKLKLAACHVIKAETLSHTLSEVAAKCEELLLAGPVADRIARELRLRGEAWAAEAADVGGVLPTSVGTDEIKAVLDAATLSKQALEQQLVATQTEELSLELQLKELCAEKESKALELQQIREERLSTLAKVEATTAHVQLEADATVIELEEAWKLCVHTQKALQAALPECVERMEGAEVGEDGPRQIEALLHEVDAMSRRITEDGLATKMAAAAQRLSKAEEGSTALDGQRGAALRAKTKKDLVGGSKAQTLLRLGLTASKEMRLHRQDQFISAVTMALAIQGSSSHDGWEKKAERRERQLTFELNNLEHLVRTSEDGRRRAEHRLAKELAFRSRLKRNIERNMIFTPRDQKADEWVIRIDEMRQQAEVRAQKLHEQLEEAFALRNKERHKTLQMNMLRTIHQSKSASAKKEELARRLQAIHRGRSVRQRLFEMLVAHGNGSGTH